MIDPLRGRTGPACATAGLIFGLLGGCAHRVTVDPIKVEPIHLTVDVRLRVDRELDDFFDFQETPPPAPAAGDLEQEAPS